MPRRYGRRGSRRSTGVRRPAGIRRKTRGTKRRTRRGGGRARGGKRKAISAINRIIHQTITTNKPIRSLLCFDYARQGNVGFQTVWTIAQCFDSWDILQAWTLWTTRFASQLPVDGSGNKISQLQNFVMGKYQADIEIKVANNLDHVIDIYKLVCRRDINSAEIVPTTYNGISTVQFIDPFTFLQIGVGDANWTSATNLGGPTLVPMGLTPFDVPYFCERFIIKRVATYRITGGGWKALRIKRPKMNLIDTETVYGTAGHVTLSPFPRTTTAFKGLTTTYMAWARCAPVCSQTDATQVIPGSPDLMIQTSEKYSFCSAFNNTRLLIPTVTAFGSVTNATQKTMLAQTELSSNYVAL